MIDTLETDFEKKYMIGKEKQDVAKSLLESLSLEEDYSNVLVLVLRPNYAVDFSNFDMYSIKGLDYVLSSCSKFETKVVDFDLKDDVIDVIKQNLTDKKYVLTLFSDTPLITKKTVLEIVDYFLIKKLCSLKFNRGYMFETEYLKSSSKIYNPLEQTFFEEDFFKVFDSSSFSNAINILGQRIISYHQSNGVIFLKPQTCYIDALVNIESGAFIGENTKILGKSVIKTGVKIFGSTLDRVIIEKDAVIENSIVTNSVVNAGAKILDFSVVKNQTIESDKIIENEKRI